MNFFEFFVDPVLRGPMVGSILASLSASVIGVLIFLRKQALISESLSHAAYPGLVLALVLASLFSQEVGLFALPAAFVCALMGLLVMRLLEKKVKTSADFSLSFVLISFFSFGVLLASYIQGTGKLFQNMQVYLFGQAATMTDRHIGIYGALLFCTLVIVIAFYKEIYVISFDSEYAKSIGVSTRLVECLLFFLVTLSIVLGIRSVGLVMMSAMLIAPAVAARQFTSHFPLLLLLASLFGMISAGAGVYFSTVLSKTHSFPTGPMIVLSGGGIALFSLLFAYEKGIALRYCRFLRFRFSQMEENILKTLWKWGHEKEKEATLTGLCSFHAGSRLFLRLLLFKLERQGFLMKENGCYALTCLGEKRGRRIVRLHRLWEAYLVESLGFPEKRVHRSAEEMEHILTPDLERRLTELLQDPKQDPHAQPIPKREGNDV